MVTKESIQQRIVELRTEEQRALAQANACAGAAQELERILSEMTTEKAEDGADRAEH